MGEGKKPEPLTSRIHEAKRKAGLLPPDEPAGPPPGRGLSLGLELAVAVLVCAGIGVVMDLWLESKPWFMLLGLLLGLVVGMWNLYRVSLGAELLKVGVDNKEERGKRGD
jgi:ATP synthase protein I